MSVSRHRIARFLADSLPIWEPSAPPRRLLPRRVREVPAVSRRAARALFGARGPRRGESAGQGARATGPSVRRRQRRPGRQPAAPAVRPRDGRCPDGPTVGKSTERSRPISDAHLTAIVRAALAAVDAGALVARAVADARGLQRGSRRRAPSTSWRRARPRAHAAVPSRGTRPAPRAGRGGRRARRRADVPAGVEWYDAGHPVPDRRQRPGRAPRPRTGRPHAGRGPACWCCCPVAGRR